MWSRKFNIYVFLGAVILVGVLLLASLFGAFAEDEGALKSDDTFLIFLARLFHILRFPTHTFFWPIIDLGGAIAFMLGLFLNCMFYGFVVERFFSIFITKRKTEF